MPSETPPPQLNGTPRGTTPDGVPVWCHFDEIADPATLPAHPRNPNRHPVEQLRLLGAVIEKNGWREVVTRSTLSGNVIKGHGRKDAAIAKGWRGVPVVWQHYATAEDEIADLVADNRIAELSRIDEAELAAIMRAVQPGTGTERFGFTEAEAKRLCFGNPNGGKQPGAMAAKFMVPPFTVLNAREGWWQDRKRQWLALGIQSELGRCAPPGGSAMPAMFGTKGQQDGGAIVRGDGKGVAMKPVTVSSPTIAEAGGSIFDPVLCELLLRWFSPPGARVLDPFAGGSVRGIVAGKLGRGYAGVDLRAEQVVANCGQVETIFSSEPTPSELRPQWFIGDSLEVVPTMRGGFDFLFSCPPYADLEVYSDDPRDLSAIAADDYGKFLELYRGIIAAAVDKLAPDRFAAWVVGDVRDREGNYRNFVGDTVEAFRAAGAHYYNEAVLVTEVGSLPVRAGRQFSASRKLGKTHQNVLVFVKGDGKRAAEACGQIEVDDGALAALAADAE